MDGLVPALFLLSVYDPPGSRIPPVEVVTLDPPTCTSPVLAVGATTVSWATDTDVVDTLAAPDEGQVVAPDTYSPDRVTIGAAMSIKSVMITRIPLLYLTF